MKITWNFVKRYHIVIMQMTHAWHIHVHFTWSKSKNNCSRNHDWDGMFVWKVSVRKVYDLNNNIVALMCWTEIFDCEPKGNFDRDFIHFAKLQLHSTHCFIITFIEMNVSVGCMLFSITSPNKPQVSCKWKCNCFIIIKRKVLS